MNELDVLITLITDLRWVRSMLAYGSPEDVELGSIIHEFDELAADLAWIVYLEEFSA